MLFDVVFPKKNTTPYNANAHSLALPVTAAKIFFRFSRRNLYNQFFTRRRLTTVWCCVTIGSHALDGDVSSRKWENLFPSVPQHATATYSRQEVSGFREEFFRGALGKIPMLHALEPPLPTDRALYQQSTQCCDSSFSATQNLGFSSTQASIDELFHGLKTITPNTTFTQHHNDTVLSWYKK